jgi:hypothetical protein
MTSEPPHCDVIGLAKTSLRGRPPGRRGYVREVPGKTEKSGRSYRIYRGIGEMYLHTYMTGYTGYFFVNLKNTH